LWTSRFLILQNEYTRPERSKKAPATPVAGVSIGCSGRASGSVFVEFVVVVIGDPAVGTAAADVDAIVASVVGLTVAALDAGVAALLFPLALLVLVFWLLLLLLLLSLLLVLVFVFVFVLVFPLPLFAAGAAAGAGSARGYKTWSCPQAIPMDRMREKTPKILFTLILTSQIQENLNRKRKGRIDQMGRIEPEYKVEHIETQCKPRASGSDRLMLPVSSPPGCSEVGTQV
jgi:hypothetical protein